MSKKNDSKHLLTIAESLITLITTLMGPGRNSRDEMLKCKKQLEEIITNIKCE